VTEPTKRREEKRTEKLGDEMTIVFLLYLSRPVLSSPFNFILRILFYSYSSFLPSTALHCTALLYRALTRLCVNTSSKRFLYSIQFNSIQFQHFRASNHHKALSLFLSFFLILPLPLFFFLLSSYFFTFFFFLDSFSPDNVMLYHMV
jgi:hypothetical protein